MRDGVTRIDRKLYVVSRSWFIKVHGINGTAVQYRKMDQGGRPRTGQMQEHTAASRRARSMRVVVAVGYSELQETRVATRIGGSTRQPPVPRHVDVQISKELTEFDRQIAQFTRSERRKLFVPVGTTGIAVSVADDGTDDHDDDENQNCGLVARWLHEYKVN